MRDDIRIVLVGTKSRLVWDHLVGNYKISLWPVQWLSVSISSFRLTEEYIDEASLQGWNPDDLRISILKRSKIFKSSAERKVSHDQTVDDIFQS